MKVLILGAGDVGLNFINFCEQEKIDFIVIDKQKNLLEPLKKRGISVFCEDFYSVSFLNKSFLKEIDLFFSVTDSDETNLIACKLAAELGVEHTVCRNKYLEVQSATQSLETKTGNYRIINPSKLLAREITRNIETPNSTEQFLFFDDKLALIGFHILNSCYLQNKPLYLFTKEFQKHFIVPIGIQKRDSFLFFKKSLIPVEGDIVYFLCMKNNIKQLRNILGYHKRKKQNICIMGGGQDCYNLLQELSNSHFHFNIRVIEEDPQKCQHLVKDFDNVMVMNLPILNKQGWLDESLDSADTLVAVGKNIPRNITSCFLATELPIQNLICSVDYSFYQNLFHYFVVNNIRTVCTHLLTARFLSQLLYSKKNLKYFTIQNSSTEFLELLVDYPLLQGHKITDFSLPQSVLFIAFYREKKVYFKVEDYHFQLGDTILFCLEKKDRLQTIKQLKF